MINLLRAWWNGRHVGLRSQCFGVRVQVPPPAPNSPGGFDTKPPGFLFEKQNERNLYRNYARYESLYGRCGSTDFINNIDLYKIIPARSSGISEERTGISFFKNDFSFVILMGTAGGMLPFGELLFRHCLPKTFRHPFGQIKRKRRLGQWFRRKRN